MLSLTYSTLGSSEKLDQLSACNNPTQPDVSNHNVDGKDGGS